MAEVLSRRIGTELKIDSLEVRSAGTHTRDGMPASEGASRASARAGLSVGDHSSSVLTRELVDWADVIFHLAAAVGVRLIVEQPVRTIETNIRTTELVLELCARKRKPVLLASTSEVYGKLASQQFGEEDDLVLGPTSKARWCYAASKIIDVNGNPVVFGGKGGGISTISDAASISVSSSVVWGNTADVEGPQIYKAAGSSISVTHSDVQGGYPGTGNINQDPLFLALGYWIPNEYWVEGDYHLQDGSPCIDSADSGVVIDEDVEGTLARPADLPGQY